MRVGFIGIGNMGWPMAANVLKAATDLDAPLTRLIAERYALAQSKLGGAPGQHRGYTELGQLAAEVMP